MDMPSGWTDGYVTESFDRSMEAALQQDNKHEFVRLIKGLSSNETDEILLLEAYGNIFSYDAANCAAAMLAGEAGEILNASYLLDREENIPLHAAARLGTPRIAALLIDNGFVADFRSDVDSNGICLKNALPLNVALETFRYMYSENSGNGNKSAIHLITKLCGCMSNAKETIKVLARNTKEIKHEFFKYLKHGKVVEVGALLVIASNHILSSSAAQGEDGIGFTNIMEMRQFLLAEILSLSVGASDTKLLRENQLMEMEETLRLLEIFDRIGDKLVAHMQIGNQLTSDITLGVAALIQDAGFDVKAEDVYQSASSFRLYQRCFRSNVLERGNAECRRKVSTTEMLPSWFKKRGLCDVLDKFGRGSHVYTPLPLPREAPVLPSLTAVTKNGSLKKHAVTKHGPLKNRARVIRALTKAISHLRYV